MESTEIGLLQYSSLKPHLTHQPASPERTGDRGGLFTSHTYGPTHLAIFSFLCPVTSPKASHLLSLSPNPPSPGISPANRQKLSWRLATHPHLGDATITRLHSSALPSAGDRIHEPLGEAP